MPDEEPGADDSQSILAADPVLDATQTHTPPYLPVNIAASWIRWSGLY